LKKSLFITPSEFDKNKLSSTLSGVSSFKEEIGQVKPIHIFDTFDWRLYNRSMTLYLAGNELYLHQFDGNKLVCSQASYQIPRFVKEMEEGSLKETLEPIVEMRALINLVGVKKFSNYFRILNSEQKTVAWIEYEDLRQSEEGGGSSLITCIRMQPVRGYNSMFSRLDAYFESNGFQRGTVFDLYTGTMRKSGIVPGDYSSKVRIKLNPELDSGSAVKKILFFLFDVMRKNESGIKDDIDSEFVHDYRVATRRTRSALTQLKGVLPQDKTDRFKADFADLGQLTNPLRDLDVFLLKEDTYRDMLPESLKDGIDPIFEHLRQERSQELEKVRLYLESPQYYRFKNDYGEFLREPTGFNSAAPNSTRQVIDLARERIYKRYRRILRDGRQAQKLVNEQDLHRLRIECKKLRYLIEFFSSLFPPEKIADLLKQMRKLQDNLGDFNDLSIQCEQLLDISAELEAGDERYTKSILAIGSLVGLLEREKGQVKDKFVDTFAGFSSKGNRELYKELFKHKNEEVSA